MKAVVAVVAAAVLSLAAWPALAQPAADRVVVPNTIGAAWRGQRAKNYDTLRGVIDEAGWPCDRVTAANVSFKISDTTFAWDATCSGGGDYYVLLRTDKIETSSVYWKDEPEFDRDELRAIINVMGFPCSLVTTDRYVGSGPRGSHSWAVACSNGVIYLLADRNAEPEVTKTTACWFLKERSRWDACRNIGN